MKAVKTKWFAPYTHQGDKLKPSLHLPSKQFQSGVYLIKSVSTGQIIYIGYSSNNLYRTIYRHFQQWNDRIPRIVYKKTGYAIRILFSSPSQAAKLEKYLILKFNPRDNSNKYETYLTNNEESQAEETFIQSNYVAPGEEYPF